MIKRIMLILTSVMMVAALAACTPTSEKNQKKQQPPAGAEQQTTADGAAEKVKNTDADPTVTVCVYSIKDDQSGLQQNMDAIDGTELDAQLLVDKMAELGVVEAGIKVDKFEQKNNTLTLDLSALEKSKDKQVQAAIANTFLQNYEVNDGELVLLVKGKKISDQGLTYNKDYKNFK
ncbi:MAG: hypothetical protein RR225_06015 [Clostridium sp.]